MHVHMLYQDHYICICEKPVGISSESPGLPEIIKEQTGRTAYPVHRLDQGTGGAMILAFTPDSCTSMQRLFQQNLVRKEYLAVISGYLTEKNGLYRDYLFHDKKQNKSYVVSQLRKGVKDASCEWTVLQSVVSEGQELSLVRIVLHTGRTHQIRVQFASRGFPLVGDRKYGSRIKAEAPALWSYHLKFRNPEIADSEINVSALPPLSFPWNQFIFDSL